MDARLIRLEEHPVEGTFGALLLDGQVFCVTLEPPDRDNAASVSNIPPGKYVCKRFHSLKHPDTFQITNVPMRNAILFHSGNTVEHTEGCVLVAQGFGKLKGNRAVLNSGNTFKEFMEKLGSYQEFDLTIEEV